MLSRRCSNCGKKISRRAINKSGQCSSCRMRKGSGAGRTHKPYEHYVKGNKIIWEAIKDD